MLNVRELVHPQCFKITILAVTASCLYFAGYSLSILVCLGNAFWVSCISEFCQRNTLREMDLA